MLRPAIGLIFAVVLAGCSQRESARLGEHLVAESRREREELKQVDAAMVHYRETAAIPTGLQNARAIALGPDDTLYVAGDTDVREIGRNAEPISDGMRLNPALEPTSLAVDASGTLYVGMGSRIELYSPSGELAARWNVPGSRPLLTSLAATADGLLVADAANRTVLLFDRTGRVIRRIGQADPATGAPGLLLRGPHLDVAVAKSGDFIITNPGRHLVETYSPEGAWRGAWGNMSQEIEGFCGCCNPVHIALMSDGRVVTSEKGLHRVKVYTGDGELESVVATPEDFATVFPELDLAVDSADRIWILDAVRGEVRCFTYISEEIPS